MTEVATKPLTELLTFQEVADFLGMAVPTIRKWSSAGAFPPPVRMGPGTRGTIRFRRSDIDQWIEDGCPKAGHPKTVAVNDGSVIRSTDYGETWKDTEAPPKAATIEFARE